MEPVIAEIVSEDTEQTEGQPDVSSPSSDESSPPDFQTLKTELLADLRSSLSGEISELREHVDKSTQRVKDKRFSKIEKRLDEATQANDIIQRFRANMGEGVDAEVAADRTLLRMLLDETSEPEPEPSPQASEAPASSDWVYARATRKVQKAGLTWDDPKLASIVARQNWNSEDEYLDAVENALGVEPQKPVTVVEPASPGSAPLSPDVEQIESQVRELQRTDPSDRSGKRKQLIKKLKELGAWE